MAYLDSTKITMFPSAFRTGDAQSSLTTEKNLTYSAVATSDFDSFVSEEANNVLRIYILGYRFEVVKSDLTSLFPNSNTIYASIKLENENGTETGINYWPRLSPIEGNALDSNNEFQGLLITDTEQSGNVTKCVKILEKVDGAWSIPNSSEWKVKATSVVQDFPNDPDGSKNITKKFSTLELVSPKIMSSEIHASTISGIGEGAKVNVNGDVTGDVTGTLTGSVIGNVTGNADTATSVNLSDDGSSNATVKIKVGSGQGYSYTVNNVAHATSSANLDSAPTVNQTTSNKAEFSVSAGGKTSGKITINDVAHAVSADSATNATNATNANLSDNGSSNATVKIRVGSGNAYSYTVNNVAHATSSGELDNAPSITVSENASTKVDTFTITAGGKTSAEASINNVAHAKKADAVDLADNGSTDATVKVKAGGNAYEYTVDNVAHAGEAENLKDTPTFANDSESNGFKLTAGGKTTSAFIPQFASTTGALKTSIDFELMGAVTGTASGIDLSNSVQIQTSIADDSIAGTKVKKATDSALGVVKGGTTTASSKIYGVSIDGNGAMTVNVPWTDTTYSSGTNIDITGSNYSYTINVKSSPTFAGNVTAQTFTATSDERLKENIESWEPKESILDLPVRQFDFKSDGSHHIGCIAQDLQKICPEIVHEREDGYLAIEESKLVYLLIDEVKKLREEIDELKRGE